MSLENTAITRQRSPELIPGYRLERMLGKGGMGEVHRAVQLSLGRTVAVKLLSDELAQDKSFVTRFEKEAAALATLSHPNIVAIVDKGKAGKTYYLVMELVGGPSLRELMRAPSFGTAEALKLAFDVCRAIDYAHNRGVMHRDLKPENILIDEQAGQIPKVSDFGLAGFLEGGPTRFNLTETHVAMGTQAYMAPEQRMDAKNADHRADIFSLGVILYELLVGEVPVGHFDPPSQRRSGVDPRLDGIVERCLKPNPAERYQKVADVITDLLPLVPVSFSQPPRAATPLARLRWWLRRSAGLAARAIGTAAVVFAFGVLALSWTRSRPHRPTLPLAAALSPELAPQVSAAFPAHLTSGPEGERVQLGDGPDHVPVASAGRAASSARDKVSFAAPESDHEVGRALLEVAGGGGHSVELKATVSAAPAKLGSWTRLSDWVRGVRQEARTALVLQGAPGHFAAVVLDASGAPARLEWAFGERHGAMLGPPNTPKAKVALEIDRTGELRAYLGNGQERRELGEPIALGAGWHKLFGKTPTPELVCLEGACELAGLDYAVHRDPPPPPEPPKPAPKPQPRPVAKASVHKAVHPVKLKRPVHTRVVPAHAVKKKKKPAHRR